jgi:pimeloyl-ACP methyl ester carboxylesterase
MERKSVDITYEGSPLHLACTLRPGNGPVILYLHGGGCARRDFNRALELAEFEKYTILSFDFPGCGETPYPSAAEFGVVDLVAITHLVIEQLALDHIILIGHSTGGLVAHLFTERYPEHIIALISVEGNMSPDSSKFSRKTLTQSIEDWEQHGFQELIATLRHSGNTGREVFADTLEQFSSPRAFYHLCPQLVDYSDNGNLVNRFVRLPLPKLYIYGSESRSMRHLDALRARHVPVQEIAHSEHFPFYDNPEEYYAAISAFLDTVEFNQ